MWLLVFAVLLVVDFISTFALSYIAFTCYSKIPRPYLIVNGSGHF